MFVLYLYLNIICKLLIPRFPGPVTHRTNLPRPYRAAPCTCRDTSQDSQQAPKAAEGAEPHTSVPGHLLGAPHVPWL